MSEPTDNQARPRVGLLDVLGLLGLGLVTAGAWQVYRPAGLIVPGIVLLGIAVTGALRR